MAVLRVHTVNTAETAVRSGINLTADYRPYAPLFCLAAELNRTVHNAVVGYGKAVKAERCRTVQNLADFCGAVEQAVLCVNV